MAAARLMKLQELRASPPASAPWSAHVFHASTPPMPSTAYPPIYLSPSSNAFTPAPAPLVSAVVSASHRSAISKAGIVGGTVAGTVLTLAVAATVISTVTGKIGIWSCLLTPALNALSSLANKLKLCSNFPHWNSKNDHYYEGSDASEDRPEIYLYEALGDPIAGSATAAAGSLPTPLREVVKGDFGSSTQALISTSIGSYAGSEMKKHESIIAPLNGVVKADHAQTFLSTSIGEFVASELKKRESMINEVVNRANQPIISTITTNYADIELKEQGSMIDEVVKINQMSKYAGTELKKQEAIINEVLRADQSITTLSMSRYAATESKKHGFTPVGCIETVSAEKGIQEMGGINKHEAKPKGNGGDNGKGKSNALAATGGKTNNLEGEATMTTGPIKPVPAKPLTAATVAGKVPTTMEHVSVKDDQLARRHPTNLGHVSFSCQISAHRFRFFAFCNSGGTYGSPPPSYISHNNNSSSSDNHDYYDTNYAVGAGRRPAGGTYGSLPPSYISHNNNNRRSDNHNNYDTNYGWRRPVSRYNEDLGHDNLRVVENSQDLASSNTAHYAQGQSTAQPLVQSYQCITAAPTTTPVTASLPTNQIIDRALSSQLDAPPAATLMYEYGHPCYGA